jgi:glycosyltransferase involved in cell wall biosynthesis
MTSNAVMEVVADGQPGGGTTAVLGLCEDLKRSLRQEVVLVTQKDSYAFRRGEALGLKVYGFDFFRSRFDRRLHAALGDLTRSVKPVLVHVHGGRAANALIGERRDFPLVYTVHGYHFPAKNVFIRPLFRYAETRIASSVDHLIFVSDSDRRIAEVNGLIAGKTNHTIIRNGIDPGLLGPNDEVARGNTIIFLSRMHRQKNPLLAVEMMSHLRDLPFRLVMIGGGALDKAVRDRIENLNLGGVVDVRGALPHEVALGHLKRARLMIFPSLWEGFPIAPIEALYFGVPVVATNIPGTDEVIAHGRTGLLVNEHTPRAMAEAVRALLTDAALWSRISANGKKDALEKFSRATNSDAHAALYQRLIG